MKKALTITAAVLVLFASTAWADEGTRVFPIPRYEAEQVISSWLKGEGFGVSASQESGGVRMSGAGKAGAWDLSLEHHSALATRITVNACPAGKKNALWEYLTGYLHRDARSVAGKRGGIPRAVMVRMGAVVCIRAEARGGHIQLTGFAVDRSGLILCTAHTLVNPESLSIVLGDGSAVKGKIVKIDFKKDLALIDCPHAFGSEIPLGGTAPPEPGTKVFSVGCPLNLGGTVSEGIMSKAASLVEGQPLLQVKMDVEPGSSGSPVFDAGGGLVAVVKGRIRSGNDTGLLIPMETVISFVKGSRE